MLCGLAEGGCLLLTERMQGRRGAFSGAGKLGGRWPPLASFRVLLHRQLIEEGAEEGAGQELHEVQGRGPVCRAWWVR